MKNNFRIGMIVPSSNTTMETEIPAMLLTYDFSDYAESSAVKAIAGEIPISGRLPIALPGYFPLGHGLPRPVPTGRLRLGFGAPGR